MTANFGNAYYRAVVYDPRIAGLFLPGQPIDREADKISRFILLLAKAQAPKSGRKRAWGSNPGSESLHKQHERRGTLRAGPLNRQYPIINKASYARYVHEGTLTTPPVAATSQHFVDGQLMGGLWADRHEINRAKSRKIVPLGNSVRGQTANPWLDNAGQYAAKLAGHRTRPAALKRLDT